MNSSSVKSPASGVNVAKYLPYILLVGMTTFFVYLFIAGISYYLTPVYDTPSAPGRAFHAMHELWRSSGLIGHSLGVVGTMMMLSIYIYVARKRVPFMRKWGPIRIWLQFHIMMGLCGPILVTFHSTGKLDQRLAALSFWAMWGVVLSGIIGRWLYSQIPKSIAGTELTIQELESEDRRLVGALRKELGLTHPIFERIDRISAVNEEVSEAGALVALQFLLKDDISRIREIRNLRKDLQLEGLPPQKAKEILILAKRKSLLMRKMQMLGAAHALFDWWHVFHKPLTVLMYGTLIVHIIVVILMGYRWIL